MKLEIENNGVWHYNASIWRLNTWVYEIDPVAKGVANYRQEAGSRKIRMEQKRKADLTGKEHLNILVILRRDGTLVCRPGFDSDLR